MTVPSKDATVKAAEYFGFISAHFALGSGPNPELNDKIAFVRDFIASLLEVAFDKCDACGSPNDSEGACTREQCYNAD